MNSFNIKKFAGHTLYLSLLTITLMFLLVTSSYAKDRKVDDLNKAVITTEDLMVLTGDDEAGYKANFPLIMNYAAMCQMMNYNPESDFKSIYPNTISVEMPKFKNKLYLFEDVENGIQTIVFRGSGNIKNALTDLDCLRVYSEKLGINVHNGFMKSCDELDPFLKPLLKKDAKIRLTGSSLGAALAAMYGMYLKHDGYDVDTIVTFGQPRITDLEGREKFKDLPLYRMVNRPDVIPSIPPHKRLGYAHFGTCIMLMNKDTYSVYTPELAELLKEDAKSFNFWSRLKSGEMSIKRHFIDLYYRIMENFVKNGVKYEKYDYKVLPEDM